MSWLDLTRKHRVVSDLIRNNTAGLERDASALLMADGIVGAEGIGRECAAFILWSFHIGIINARTSSYDRCIARLLLERELRRTSRRFSVIAAPDADLVSIYRQRCRDALATTPNIFLYRQQGRARPSLPVTRAGARLFLRHIAGRGPAPPHLLDRLVDLLGDYFWSCVAPLNPIARTRFP